MLSRASAARQVVATAARHARGNATQLRGFIAPTAARRADLVQDLYLRELKAYKVPPVKDTDAQGQVQTFKIPATPKSPEEADLASSIKEYESMAVEVEGQASAPAGEKPAQPVLEDWLVIEDDEPTPAHH